MNFCDPLVDPLGNHLYDSIGDPLETSFGDIVHKYKVHTVSKNNNRLYDKFKCHIGNNFALHLVGCHSTT